MLPHIDDLTVKDISSNKKENILRLKANANLDKIKRRLDAEKLADIQDTIQYIPELEVIAEAFVPEAD